MQAKKQKITGIILALGGSKSGPDKALLEIYGETLLGITYYKIKPLFDKIFIITDSYEKKAQYSKILGEDILVSKGLLGAALTGLKACRTEYAFLASCDMPLINKKAVEIILNKPDHEVVIPKHENGKLEPLHALYKVKQCISAFQSAMNDEKFNFNSVLEQLKDVLYVPAEEFKEVDLQLQTFFRVNSEVDFLLAKERLKSKTFKGRLEKARTLQPKIEKATETATSIYYNIPGTEETHEVRFDKRKKMWNCDCKHFSVKGTYCSHILAAQKKGENV